MKKALILLLLIANLGLGVQSFAITQDELNAQVDEAALNRDIRKLLSLAGKYPNDKILLITIGWFYANEGNSSEAKKWYLKAIENGSSLAYFYLGRAYVESEEYKKGLDSLLEYNKILKEILIGNPYYMDYVPEYFYWTAEAYYGLGDYKNAKNWYLIAIDYIKQDNYFFGHPEQGLGIVSRDEKNYKEAEKWFLASIRKGFLRSYYSLSLLYEEINDIEALKKSVREGIVKARNAGNTELVKDLEKRLREAVK